MHHGFLSHAIWSYVSVVCASLASCSLASPAAAQVSRATMGEWSAVIDFPNVPIHAHVLPNGKVLFWGRREIGNPDLDVTSSTPWLWNPVANTFAKTGNKPGYNVFCAGHAFMADGKLFVAGGHQGDGRGEPIASTYDYRTDRWTKIPKLMKGGRWYPTATTLPDGGILVSFGTMEDPHDANRVIDNNTQEIWKDGDWTEIVDFRFPKDRDGDMPRVPPFYPRMHVIPPDGHVFMTGPLALTQILDPHAQVQRPEPQPDLGDWEFLCADPNLSREERLRLSERKQRAREYAPSVAYDVGKIIYIGGGNPPTAKCEVVDVTETDRRWRPTGDMTLPRRQHNATLLPDGAVLVTGGTKGDGDGVDANDPIPKAPGTRFNDLRVGQPLRSAEIWNPDTGKWTRLAQAARDRCYHSVSLLLPNATVLSAGGGEYRPYDFKGNFKPNHPDDSHPNGQIFAPPYLFAEDGSEAARPAISDAPDEVQYGDQFAVETPDAATIRKVSWIRLPSVTHAFDAGQRINFLEFSQNGAGTLAVAAPDSPNDCPPGHYMLF
ncbi:MAG: DUF1929 domain-containing protein, partial [Planctomycetes bacterium]|nr:DUF1929 domain-containing protein [Planctomycetota bacterium]